MRPSNIQGHDPSEKSKRSLLIGLDLEALNLSELTPMVFNTLACN